MRYLIAAAACVTLSGCASTQDVLSREPTQVLSSDKNYIDVASCIGDLNNTIVLEKSDGSRVIAMKGGYGNVGTVYTVRPSDKGSTLEIRQPGMINITKYRRCL